MRLDFGQIEVMDKDMVEILRAKTPAERLAIADGMWVSARRMLIATLQAEHPEWSNKQVEQETARRLSHATD